MVKLRKRQRTRRKRKSTRRSRPSKSFSRKVKKVIFSTAEHKYVDLYQSVTPLNNATAVFPLVNTISQGSGQGQRIGQKIKIRSITLTVQTQLVAGYSPSLQRLILGVWRDYWTTTPSASKLVDDPTDPWKTMYKRDNLVAKLWRPIYDRKWDQTYTDPTTSRYKYQTFKLFGKRLPTKTIDFNGGGIESAYYFMYLWDTSVGAAPFNALSYRTRVTYTDV